MDGAEILGKTLKCTYAKAETKLQEGKAVWSSEDWINNNMHNNAADSETNA
jgi:hypothetical protein